MREIYLELVVCEAEYVSHMHRLRDFMRDMADMAPTWQNVVRKMLGPLKLIIAFSERLHQELSRAKDASDVGQVFIGMCPFFNGLGEYLAHVHWAFKAIGDLMDLVGQQPWTGPSRALSECMVSDGERVHGERVHGGRVHGGRVHGGRVHGG